MPSFLLMFILGIVLAYIYENLPLRRIFKRESLVVKGYKLHHSLYGLLLIIISVFTDQSMFFVGLGIIVEHFLTGGGFDFITKEQQPIK